jgi:hypothetical protein
MPEDAYLGNGDENSVSAEYTPFFNTEHYYDENVPERYVDETGLVWDETAHRYVYRTESDELVNNAYPDNPCNCEHPSHFSDMPEHDPNQHEYLMVAGDGLQALYVGEICKTCANGHYAQFVR